jgi:hypothetical protein
MNMFKLGIIRFRSMDSWAGLRERNPTVRLKHMKTTSTRTLLSSVSSSGLNSFLRKLLISFLPRCGYLY